MLHAGDGNALLERWRLSKGVSMRLLLLIGMASLIAAPATADERAAAAYNASVGGVSFLVIKNGAIVYEDYPNGGRADRAWNLASGTKSFSCAIAAAAVRDGIPSLDEPAADTLTEWRTDPLRSQVTIRQILSLTSGLHAGPIGRAPTYSAAVETKMRADPGESFAYGPVNFQVFGEIMRRKLARFDGGRFKDPASYLEARVLRPIGATPAAWKRGRDGQPTLPHGSEFTARNWARYGQFALEGGAWKGRALVDRTSFSECFKGSAANPAYGLAWWLNREPSKDTLAASRTMTVASDLFTHPRRGEIPRDLFMAAGAGGQRLYVIPSQNLVIVRQYPRLMEPRRKVRRGESFSDVEFLLRLLD
jgi:CubicO group peptidase (beta-lactamase class C family)